MRQLGSVQNLACSEQRPGLSGGQLLCQFSIKTAAFLVRRTARRGRTLTLRAENIKDLFLIYLKQVLLLLFEFIVSVASKDACAIQ